MLLSSGVNFGFKRTIPHLLGISCGFFVMLLAVGAGLEKIFQEVPTIYKVIKVVGFLYLIYLAWGIATSSAPINAKNHNAKPLGFIGAALFQWVNPKTWMMAVGYFSSYRHPDTTTTFIFLTCLMFSLITFPSISIWALIGNKLEHRLQDPLYRQVFNKTMAGLLIFSMISVLLIEQI